jgi:hypothetical protein
MRDGSPIGTRNAWQAGRFLDEPEKPTLASVLLPDPGFGVQPHARFQRHARYTCSCHARMSSRVRPRFVVRKNRRLGSGAEIHMATDNQADGTGWGNVRFRPRRVGTLSSGDDAAQSRFVQGAVLFVVVTLAYPWYAYWVQSRLLAADANRALSAIEEEIRALPDAADIMIGEPAPTLPIQVRSAAPRILGVSEGAALSVIVADLHGSSLDAATTQLCAEAVRWTRRPIAGRTFRVQAYHRSQPATTVGTIRC